jgi:lipoprotein NlpI
MRRILLLVIALLDDHPLSAEERARMKKEHEEAVARWTKAIEAEPSNVEAWSRRGDARFFRGEFKEAAADYDRMAALKESLGPSHWRRGIAWFYAGEHAKAARQFEEYHSHDDVDRENGIWRFLSQAKAHGLAKAREGLLKYRKDDREPFPAVYELFAGRTTPEKILEGIKSAELGEEEREKRLFYAHLYVGLNFAIEEKREPAAVHLRAATANAWGPKGGYGPSFMWHVGRLHYESLAGGK